jgi:hypothetical protein
MERTERSSRGRSLVANGPGWRGAGGGRKGPKEEAEAPTRLQSPRHQFERAAIRVNAALLSLSLILASLSLSLSLSPPHPLLTTPRYLPLFMPHWLAPAIVYHFAGCCKALPDYSGFTLFFFFFGTANTDRLAADIH